MTISSNALFHFTSSIDNLISILTNEFHPKYCLEDIRPFFPNLQSFGESAIPMVSFCDLPLSNVSEHLACYGEYGIGMKKEWGIKKEINPVLYLSEISKVRGYFSLILDKTLHSINAGASEGNREIIEPFLELLGFLKPYKGKMHRNGEYIDKIFYNEREWRYVPALVKMKNADKSISDRLPRKYFFDKPRLSRENNLIAKDHKLSFEPSDIKYIIVEKEDQILSMVKAIEQIKGIKYKPDTIKILSSRVISAEQILEDF